MFSKQVLAAKTTTRCYQLKKPYLTAPPLSQVQSIKQNNSSFKQSLAEGVDGSRPTDVSLETPLSMPFPSFPYPLFTASFLACIQFSPPLISLQFVPLLIYSRGPSSTPSRQYFTPRGTDSSLNLLIALLLPSSSLSPPLVSYHLPHSHSNL